MQPRQLCGAFDLDVSTTGERDGDGLGSGVTGGSVGSGDTDSLGVSSGGVGEGSS